MTHPQNPLPPTAGRPNPAATKVPQSPPARRTGLLLAVTLVVAVLALVVGVAGVAVAALALGRSDRAVSLAKDASAAPVPAAAHPGPTEATPAPGSTDDATTAPDPTDPTATPTEINPSAQFTIAYQGQNLRVRSTGCNSGNHTYIDLDEPRVLGTDNSPTAEISYQGCAPGHLYTELAFGQVANPNATPAHCLEAIRTDPGQSPVAATSGTTLCFETSQDLAANQGLSQKLVFVTINSVTTDNETGVINVTAKAWAVPR